MLENHYYVKNYNYNKSFTYKNIISFYISRSVSQIFMFSFFTLRVFMFILNFTGLVHKGTRETGVLCSVLVLSVSVSISPR